MVGVTPILRKVAINRGLFVVSTFSSDTFNNC